MRSFKHFVEAKANGVLTQVKSKVNGDLSDLSRTYHRALPIRDIEAILGKYGIQMANEDGTPFSAIFAGREGRTTIDLMFNGMPVENSILALTWYKMPETGNYEITAYLS